MKKKCLFLMMALLAGTTLSKSYAGDGNGEETVATKQIRSYQDLKDAVSDIKNIATLENELAVLKQRVSNKLNNEPSQTVLEDVSSVTVNDVYTALRSFWATQRNNGVYSEQYDFAKPAETIKATDSKISYLVVKEIIKDDLEDEGAWTTGVVLYVTISTVAEELSSGFLPQLDPATEIPESWEWKTVSIDATKTGKDAVIGTDQKIVGLSGSFDKLVVLYKVGDKIDGREGVGVTGLPPSVYVYNAKLVNAINGLITGNDVRSLLVEAKIEKDVPKENPLYGIWQKEYNDLVDLRDAKQIEVDNAKSITILEIAEDITVTDNNTRNFTWPKGYTIVGGNHKISGVGYGRGQALFYENQGVITNLIVPEGSVAGANTAPEGSTNVGVVENSIVKYDKGWRVYDDRGNISKETSDLVEAVYMMREFFGCDVVSGDAGTLTDENRLYQARNVYKEVNGEVTTIDFKVNIKNKEVVYKKSGIQTENAFIYIDDDDVPVEDEEKFVPMVTTTNVVVKTKRPGKPYICANAGIVEGSGKREFYATENFTAKNLSYARKVTSTLTAVCLPFSLTDNILTSLKEKAGVDLWYYNFANVDTQAGTMWFNQKGAIAANAPCLIASKEAPKEPEIFNGLTDVEFLSTVSTDLGDPTVEENKRVFFGNYKADQLSGDLASAHSGEGSAVYGIQKGELVRMPAYGSKMQHFRSFVIGNNNSKSSSSVPKSFRIGLLDENGNEVTAIESVNSGKGDGFKVVGGNNAVAISAEKACEVKVYTASGSLVKAVRVEAGNTTLPLSAGMYIVNQTKVVVK